MPKGGGVLEVVLCGVTNDEPGKVFFWMGLGELEEIVTNYNAT